MRRVTLGTFIANRRKYMQFTQDELAKKINVSKSAIAKWETNGGVPDRDNLKKLADALGVKVSFLYRLIDGSKAEDADFGINITADIIVLLESYGYKVIRPDKDEEKMM